VALTREEPRQEGTKHSAVFSVSCSSHWTRRIQPAIPATPGSGPKNQCRPAGPGPEIAHAAGAFRARMAQPPHQIRGRLSASFQSLGEAKGRGLAPAPGQVINSSSEQTISQGFAGGA